eukprot:181865_1
MPNIEMMDNKCCKAIVEDIKNVKNHRVAIQFKWASSKPLQLIHIQKLIHQYAETLTTVSLKTQIDEDKSNSIKVHCSKLTKYKIKSINIVNDGFRKLQNI